MATSAKQTGKTTRSAPLSLVAILFSAFVFVALNVWPLANSLYFDTVIETIAREVADGLLGARPNLPDDELQSLSPDQRAELDRINNTIYLFTRRQLAVILYVGFTSILTILTFVFVQFKTNQRSLADISNEISEAAESIERVHGSIKGNLHVEAVDIAMFDTLIAYSPLYIAKGLGYFKEEGLDIAFNIKGGDKQVASSLVSAECHFGVCDPIIALIEPRPTYPLKILMPLGKRLDVYVTISERMYNDFFQSGRKVNKKISVLTYPRPSTSYTVALRLINDLRSLGLDAKPENEIPGSDIFHNPSALFDKLKTVDFAVLWSPASDWVIEDDAGDSGHYIFSIAENALSLTSKAEVRVMRGSRPQREVMPWHPMKGQATGMSLLASALMVNDYAMRQRPDLCRRMFRALSRSLIRIEGTNWTSEDNKSERLKLWYSVHSQLHEMRRGHVTQASLKRLVEGYPIGSGKSLFPFIESMQQYEESSYSKHLMHMKQFWNHDESVRRQLSRINARSEDEYKKCFVTFDRE